MDQNLLAMMTNPSRLPEILVYLQRLGQSPVAQADLLRHIIGNPFRPMRLAPAEPSNVFAALDVLAKEASREPKAIYALRSVQTPLTMALASTLYAGDQTAAPILHDALEEVGASVELLEHFAACERCNGTGECGPSWDGEDSSYLCRCGGKPIPHPKGCWAVDLLLGKE